MSAVFVFLLSSCSKDNSLEDDFQPATYNVLGKVEKGPFVSGSTITIQPMDGSLQVLGSLYSATIQDNLGNFSFGSKLFEAPYAELTANGYFFNEVSGELSKGTLNLRALVDLSDKTTVNVNLLTHLKYQRIQKLIANGLKFGEANKQAQEELFSAFGLKKYAENDASTFSIAGGTDESAALIAISSLLLIDRSEAELTEFLAKLCMEFGEKGNFEESTKKQINEDKKELLDRLSSVRDNIIERYGSLGLNVEVKELGRFIDWDNDGVAGNEMLQDGQAIKLETTELDVPNEGGVYKIGISSPIPVYLEPQLSSDGPHYSDDSSATLHIYEENIVDYISMEESIADNILTVTIKPLNSRNSKTANIEIFDGIDNVIGTIHVMQEGNSNAPIPKLGDDGKDVVSDIASDIAEGLSDLNVIEQYYHWNNEADVVDQNINPSSSTISNIWRTFYRAIGIINTFRYVDAEQSGIYQEYLDVFSAMLYYYMTVAWGDVPYIKEQPSFDTNINRTAQNEIFADLKANLEKAIDYLEEKKNIPLSNNANDYFFLSKDVARILLANIHMYQGEHGRAEQLLKQVIDNHFYDLDASNYNNPETINALFDNGSSRETIFATRCNYGTRGITIAAPMLVPIMTYTDVILSYAECLYKNGKVSDAEEQLTRVIKAKNISVSGSNVLEKIKDARLKLMLYTNTNFAFMKRNSFFKDTYGVEEYRSLLPIPNDEIIFNASMTQNPGY